MTPCVDPLRMEAAILLRTLWRHRRILAIGAIFAVLAGSMIAYRLPSFESRSFQVANATEEILVDTQASQIVQANQAPGSALGPTATLLATVMTQGKVKQAIAHQAGLLPANLATIAPSAPSGSSPTGQNPPSDSYVRHAGTGIMIAQTLTNANGDPVPIIQVQTRASTVDRAVALVNAAASNLNSYVTSTAAAEKVPKRQQLRVSALGPPEASAQTSGPGPLLAAGAAMLVFGLVCAGIILAGPVSRGWRNAAAREREELERLDLEVTDGPGDRRTAVDGAVAASPRRLVEPVEDRTRSGPVEDHGEALSEVGANAGSPRKRRVRS
jgi:hypothetical protein